MNSSLIQLHIHRCTFETGSFYILSKGVSQCNSDVTFPGGQKKPSDINQVFFYYNIKNLLKKEKKAKLFPTLPFQLGLVPTQSLSLLHLATALPSLSESFLLASWGIPVQIYQVHTGASQ